MRIFSHSAYCVGAQMVAHAISPSAPGRRSGTAAGSTLRRRAVGQERRPALRGLGRSALWLGAAAAAAVLSTLAATAQDAAVTDPEFYKVLFENERVRVLEYSDMPGDRTEMHSHPAFVVYSLSAFKRRLTLPDGKVIDREFEPGQVLFSEAQAHSGENVGSTVTHIVMVELKE